MSLKKSSSKRTLSIVESSTLYSALGSFGRAAGISRLRRPNPNCPFPHGICKELIYFEHLSSPCGKLRFSAPTMGPSQELWLSPYFERAIMNTNRWAVAVKCPSMNSIVFYEPTQGLEKVRHPCTLCLLGICSRSDLFRSFMQQCHPRRFNRNHYCRNCSLL